MKFHLATSTGNLVTGTGPGWIRIGAVQYRENLVLTPAQLRTGWAPGGFDILTDTDFAQLLETSPAVVLFGTGRSLRFPHPRLTHALMNAHVGLEVMDTAAACRTFNILATEGREVTAALLLEV